MPHCTLLSASALSPHIGDESWAVVDCRFSLGDKVSGLRSYLQAHISGAVYANLDEDLSNKPIPGKTGRHPLRSIAAFSETLSKWGIDAGTQVVAYDDAGGAMAARLWWMLNWAGHRGVALLDGGWEAWRRYGGPTSSGREQRSPKRFLPNGAPELAVNTKRVEEIRSDPNYLLLDARSPARFRGEVEPIDPVAGHIPGAISAPYEENLASDGTFLPRDALRHRFQELLKSVPPDRVICYCGSGVSATQNILALTHAGLPGARLYVGSWSEWVTDSSRPIAKG